MSDNSKKEEKEMEKKIFISGDGFLAVFELLPPRQLGLGIALISHRFDFYVDEHFKTRRWSLKYMEIRGKIGENGVTEMEIVNDREESLPIPNEPMPKKVIGFKRIFISYIGFNVFEFLSRFSSLFANCGINLCLCIDNGRLFELFMRNIWPLLKDGIRQLQYDYSFDLRNLQLFGNSSILSDCPSLRFVFSTDNVFPEFSPDDCANALDGQAMDKWLFSARPDGVPKVLKYQFYFHAKKWPSQLEGLKAAFSNASSRANFIIVIWLSFDPVVFDLTNELTGEQLTLKRANNDGCFLVVRRPILRNVNQWTKWEKEAIEWDFYGQRNQISIYLKLSDNLFDTFSLPECFSSESESKLTKRFE
ncbi:hypothetical protein niasHT_026625 [Heterodera trifolii]|uniref:F-box associated domain-containing protein n=1 Tax=Heterodera trifolii TaxID=157864 RepID=A0ABD2KTD2_9BILA